jgi:hypothetical protein
MNGSTLNHCCAGAAAMRFDIRVAAIIEQLRSKRLRAM